MFPVYKKDEILDKENCRSVSILFHMSNFLTNNSTSNDIQIFDLSFVVLGKARFTVFSSKYDGNLPPPQKKKKILVDLS